MPKLYAIPMILYIEAFDKNMATGEAELKAFAGTEALRKIGSGWVTDNVTTLSVNGRPSQVDKLPDDLYNKETLMRCFGEDEAIRFLNSIVNHVHL